MASTAAPTSTPTPMEFPKSVLFSSIIDNESPPKRAVKTRKWLMTINFAKPQTERDALFVQNWIETKFKNSIYCDPSLATGTPLCEKIRMMLYVENRGRYKAEKAARKLANAARNAEKLAEHQATMRRAAQKRRDKEAVQIAKATAAHNGDANAGLRAWNAKIQKDQAVAKVKRAEKATRDCSKTADFTKFRCGTPLGQSYDQPLQPFYGTYLSGFSSYSTATKKTMLRLASKDAFKTFAYLCKQKKTNLHLEVKTGNKTLHQYGIYRVPITGGPSPRREVTALHIEQGATRRLDKDMCGKVNKFYHPAGDILYVNINNKTTNLYRLLPREWRDFGGYKTAEFTAEPKTAVSTPLMFGLRDNGIIHSFSWDDNGTRYTALVQDTGNKTFADIQNLGKAHYQDAIKKAEEAAKQQAAQKRRAKESRSEIYRAFFGNAEVNSNPSLYNFLAPASVAHYPPPPAPAATTAKRFCADCGTTRAPQAKFCHGCGTSLA